ncbi:DUF2935 domain-containing protein [Fictibacillus nanhaiensis]|uniref:DUF2935 domain-containing protein n=1 Tax=Fictibacillus nanhaiensis TaxID=742169 RepID=UPI001C964AFF|nr:DUF2935 domain-containing protein [Fictibacillus nanhaiensis]MBY6036896.1 DUF2935 domain-containing protein [Fictibacillus nanhaiensis]
MAFERITPYEEHRFWLEILEDHAYFIRDYLSPSESNWVEMAKKFIVAFAELRVQLQQLPVNMKESNTEAIHFSKKAYNLAYDYFQFEGHLQRLRIENKINLNLPPSYLNGTLNENQEYLRLLSFYVKGQTAPALPLVDLLDLWLEDQVGHAALLNRSLDGIEIPLLQKALHYKTLFGSFVLQNDAIKGFLRFTPANFPSQVHFAREVAVAVVEFTQLVKYVVSLYINDEVFNQTTLRFLEHHFPEACYFLKKLSYYAPDIEYPTCSLSKPSFRS